MRSQIAEECKNDYAAQLQKFNQEQNRFYFNDMPIIFNVSGDDFPPPRPLLRSTWRSKVLVSSDWYAGFYFL